MRPKIVIAGGTGFVGRHLTADLVARGYDVIVLTRGAATVLPNVRGAIWDGHTVGAWAGEVEGALAVINLAGRSINTRHTSKHKQEIKQSRVDSTRVLGEAIARAKLPPRAWVQASALALYGNTGARICDEACPPADDFSAAVAKHWEQALFEAPNVASRRVALRIGLVLGPDGGALPTLATMTKLFLGGRAGTGQQYISWIHIADLVEMFAWAVEHDDVTGAFNACTPGAVTNDQFMRELRRVLRRPWSPPAPAWAVRLGAAVLGTESDLVLSGRRCVPRRFQEKGFQFAFAELRAALANLFADDSRQRVDTV